LLALVLCGPPVAASFVTPPVYAAGPTPQSVAVGDFNGDGISDLAVANYGSDPKRYTDSGMSILLGKGDGTFQAPGSYSVSGRVRSVAVGDFNGDGYPDFAVGYAGGVAILLNGTDWP